MGEGAGSREPCFRERYTAPVVADAYRLGAPPALAALVCLLAGWVATALFCLAIAAFVVVFFRNPRRSVPGDERTVVAPADGRVLDVGRVEDADGTKRLRVAIFLSIFDVHVNRAPVPGRVVSVERAGSEYVPAFNYTSDRRNVRCRLVLETEQGERVDVVQIAGLVARRIVCQPRAGEWLRRGDRFGMIRFGSRTDVILPETSKLLVSRGDRVHGGSSPVARLPEAAS